MVDKARDNSPDVTESQLQCQAGRPADDAADARWADAIELESLPITEGLTETLTRWGLLG